MIDKLVIAKRLPLISGITAYTHDGEQRKRYMHRHGKAFLVSLAQSLGLPEGSYDIRSNKGGIAVSGEVTLHADRLYVQLHESCIGTGGVNVLYRTCDGRTDYAGGLNHTWPMYDLATHEEHRARFLTTCAAMVSGSYSPYALLGKRGPK